jgi:hypothetical protein
VFIPAVKNLPILGYFYFEVISEYLMLYQETKNSLHYAKAGEFYNPTYKELMYALHPGLKRSSRLSEFYPGLNKLITYLETAKLFKQFDGDHFTKYLMNRLICLTNSRLFDLSENLIDWRRFEWNFENLALKAKRLVGHLIHRELRSFGRYPNFYFYFDQTKALQAWNYWNHMNIIIPFNGTFPKGEVGINPAYPDLNYKAYIGNVNKNNNYSYVEPIEEIKFEIEPRLVDLRHTQMRASGRFIND